MLGSWNIDVITGGMPEKIATAFGELNELVGAEYSPIAYLGSQEVNGTNHAVLAEQTLVCGKDVKNIVLVIFYETKEGVTVSNIERVVEGGEAFGGTTIDPKVGDDIPEDAKAAFETVLGQFVGANIKPFALLATHVVKGTNYVFAAEVELVDLSTDASNQKKVAVITVNPLVKKASFADVLKCELEVALGKPLGEWP